MTSLPNPSTTPILLSTPIPNNSSAGKRHRHRRSAAISGDFDAMGLGLFSPPPSSVPKKSSIPEFDIDKHFQFDNDEDFSERAKTLEFSFPNAPSSQSPIPSSSPHYHSTGIPSPRLGSMLTSPPKKLLHHQSISSLNSPIRLGKRSHHSVHLPPKNRFFLTEETNLNNENIPDAVIDLDEVLSANLHIGDHNVSSNTPHPVHEHLQPKSDLTMVAPFEMYPDETLLSSPFYKLYPSPFISSPLSTSHNLLFQQPIQEQNTDDIEELEEQQDIDESLTKQPQISTDDLVTGRLSTSASASDLEQEMFPNPQTVLGGLYSNDSANSSCSSLRSSNRNVLNPLIEKTFSNDSSNNNYHYGTVSTPTQNSSGNKRSGAKATRYQSFYDQSFKISNALKVSSTESVNIVRTTSNDSGSIQLPKEVRILGHSSSLPSLKTVLNKRSNQKLRFNEIRISSVASNNSTNSTVGSSGQARKLSPPIQVKNKVSNNSHPNLNMVPNNTPPKTIGPLPIITKHDSNSPISVNSEVSSTIISSNATIQTEHSSLHDQQTGSFASKDSEQHTIVDIPTPQIVISTEEDKSILTPISNNDDNNNNSNYNNEDQDQNINNMSLTSNEVLSIIAGSIVSGANTGPKNTSPSKTAPTSAVSPISASFPTGSTTPTKTKPSSNSTNLTRTSIKPPSTSSSYITTKHSSNRRPLSPQQESFLKQTQIPSFKVNLHTETSQKNGTLQAGSQSLPENKRNVQVQPLQTQNKHYQHRKSKSMSLSTGQENENDDLSSLRLSGSKRNSRFINWLKRK